MFTSQFKANRAAYRAISAGYVVSMRRERSPRRASCFVYWVFVA